MSKIIKDEGEIVLSGELIAQIELESGSLESSSEDQETKEVVVKDIKSDETINAGKSIGHGPAIRRLLDEHNIDSSNINGSGKGGRITKTDIKSYLDNSQSPDKIISNESSNREEERVPMSRMRSTIARRLLSVSQETAMLTTFNEVDMKPIKDLRNEYGDEFKLSLIHI